MGVGSKIHVACDRRDYPLCGNWRATESPYVKLQICTKEVNYLITCSKCLRIYEINSNIIDRYGLETTIDRVPQVM